MNNKDVLTLASIFMICFLSILLTGLSWLTLMISYGFGYELPYWPTFGALSVIIFIKKL